MTLLPGLLKGESPTVKAAREARAEERMGEVCKASDLSDLEPRVGRF